MLFALTVLLLAPPQDVGPTKSSAEEKPASSVQLQASRTSFSLEASSSSRVAPEKSEELVAYQPGRLVPEPVSSAPAPPANAAQVGTRDIRGLGLPAPRLPRRRIEASPRQRHMWYALMITGHGAAAFDAWSTRRAITQGGGQELNPLLKPFANSGALYAAVQASPLLMDYLGRRMMTSRHPWMRRIWWLPQTAGAGMSIVSGVHNVRLVH